jgi:hypothetical protein
MAERQVSAGAGLLFKGSGFYLTDYGRNAHRRTEGAPSDSQSSDGAKTEGGDAAAKKTAGADAKASDASSGEAGGSTKASSNKPATNE